MTDKSIAHASKYIAFYQSYKSFCGTINATLLFNRLEFRFGSSDKYTDGFFKFTASCPGHKLYKEGDSWLEETTMSREEFDTAYLRIGTRHKSKSAFDLDPDPFKGMMYCSYVNKIDHVTYYFRNHELVDNLLGFVRSKSLEFDLGTIGKTETQQQKLDRWLNPDLVAKPPEPSPPKPIKPRSTKAGKTHSGTSEKHIGETKNPTVESTNLQEVTSGLTTQERSEASRIYQTIDVTPNSGQQQDMNGQQEVNYTSFDADPNISRNPPSAPPLNSLAVVNNYEYVESEQVTEKLTPYLAVILDRYTRGEIEKIPDMQVKQIARVTLGNFPKKYRTEGFIMGSSNDIFADFKKYVFESCKFSTMIKAINYIKSLEKDPNKHDDLKTLVLEYELKKTGTTIHQAMRDFKMQQVQEHSDGSILDGIRKGLYS